MADFVHLQILSGPLIALTPSGAQAPAVPATAFALPPPSRHRCGSSTASSQQRRSRCGSTRRRLRWWRGPGSCSRPMTGRICCPSPARPWPRWRAHPAAHTAPPAHPSALRLLALTAAPRDLTPVDARPALELLRGLDADGIAVTIRKHGLLEDLQPLLAQAQPDLLVLLAHGRPGALLIEGRNGESFALRAAELATLLKRIALSSILCLCERP